MTVGELIKKLQKYNPDMNVYVHTNGLEYSSVFDGQILDFSVGPYYYPNVRKSTEDWLCLFVEEDEL